MPTTPALAVEVLLSEAVPNLTASQPSLTNNPNPLNTPPATGLLAPPQSPGGYINAHSPNFAISETSTQCYLTSMDIEGVQQGTLALTALTQQTIQGCPSVQVNNWYSGSVGTIGNKFS